MTILLSYISGILLSNSEIKISYFIIAILGGCLFILHMKNIKTQVLLCLIFLIIGMIYPQIRISLIEPDIADKTKINKVVTVVEISDNDLIVKLDKKKYIIFYCVCFKDLHLNTPFLRFLVGRFTTRTSPFLQRVTHFFLKGLYTFLGGHCTILSLMCSGT